MRGIRNNWIGLQVKVEKTKETGVITKNLDNGFEVTTDKNIYILSRPDFVVLRCRK